MKRIYKITIEVEVEKPETALPILQDWLKRQPAVDKVKVLEDSFEDWTGYITFNPNKPKI